MKLTRLLSISLSLSALTLLPTLLYVIKYPFLSKTTSCHHQERRRRQPLQHGPRDLLTRRRRLSVLETDRVPNIQTSHEKVTSLQNWCEIFQLKLTERLRYDPKHQLDRPSRSPSPAHHWSIDQKPRSESHETWKHHRSATIRTLKSSLSYHTTSDQSLNTTILIKVQPNTMSLWIKLSSRKVSHIEVNCRFMTLASIAHRAADMFTT